ncbi:MAG: hypothetical protein A2X23_04700 [Chloroflexi bacterium GWC2_73_18]|nr:MAG: hypothetical protein A2X23_04700 [Chloroflexi bacterium GWC2_73_18]
MKRLLVIAASALLVAAACTADDGGRIDHPTGPSDLVLRIDIGGGLMGPGWALTHLPIFSLFGDGRIVTEGPQIEIYPGPALPNLQQTRISEAGIQRILEAARDAGLLGPDAHYDWPGIMDAPTTTFTVVAGGARHVVSAYALFEGSGGNDARAALRAIYEQLTDFRSWLGAQVVGPDAAYVYDALRITVRPADPSGAPDPGMVNIRDWPLAVPLAAFGTPAAADDVRCGVLSGGDLDGAMADLASSNQLTYWRSGGATYQLGLRPLLPDESGCGENF